MDATGQAQKAAYAGPKLSYTVDEFCAASGIPRSTFYMLVKAGKGPRLMRAGRRTLISAQAAADWHRHMEASTAAGAPAPTSAP